MSDTKEELIAALEEAQCGVAFIVTKEGNYKVHHFEHASVAPVFVIANRASACLESCRALIELNESLISMDPQYRLLTDEAVDAINNATASIRYSIYTLAEQEECEDKRDDE